MCSRDMRSPRRNTKALFKDIGDEPPVPSDRDHAGRCREMSRIWPLHAHLRPSPPGGAERARQSRGESGRRPFAGRLFFGKPVSSGVPETSRRCLRAVAGPWRVRRRRARTQTTGAGCRQGDASAGLRTVRTGVHGRRPIPADDARTLRARQLPRLSWRNRAGAKVLERGQPEARGTVHGPLVQTRNPLSFTGSVQSAQCALGMTCLPREKAHVH